MQLEARQYAAYLGKGLSAPLASEVESAGDLSVESSLGPPRQKLGLSRSTQTWISCLGHGCWPNLGP